MEPNEQPAQPLDIEVFLPEKVELIDPRFPPQRPPQPQRSRRRLFSSSKPFAIGLFALTFVSTFVAGMVPGGGPFHREAPLGKLYIRYRLATEEFPDEVKTELLKLLPYKPGDIRKLVENGLTFSGALLLILFAHEMGHYLQARRYRVPATYPLFIPFPLSPLGTLGAVIVQGAGVANRKSLFDIAISGPLAGLVFALPITYFGLKMSHVVTIPPGYIAEVSYQDPLIIKWMVGLIHHPLAANEDVQLNALLFAGWAGILVTALNLVPIGQLDGGHILYTLLGKRAHPLAMLLLGAAIVYMVITGNYTYSLIVILLVVFGPRHPPTADDTVPLGWFRVLLGWLTLCFIIVGFTPDPLNVTSRRQEPQVPQQQQQGKPRDPILKQPHYVDAADSPRRSDCA